MSWDRVASLAALLRQAWTVNAKHWKRSAEYLLARGVQYAPREPSTIDTPTGRIAIPSMAELDARGAAQGLGEPPAGPWCVSISGPVRDKEFSVYHKKSPAPWLELRSEAEAIAVRDALNAVAGRGVPE